MTVVNSSIYKNLIQHHTLEIGDTYFFKNFTLLEFYEGINLTFDNLKELFELINKYYGNKKSFGIIANRLNSYSLTILDIEKFENKLKNLSAYAVVTYTHSAKQNLEYENHFFNIKRKHFSNILEAEKWMAKKVS